MNKQFLASPHIEGITLCVGEEIDKVAGGASCMGVDRIGEVGERANEEQVAGMYGQVLQVGLWQGWDEVGGIKVRSDKELMEVGRMA